MRTTAHLQKDQPNDRQQASDKVDLLQDILFGSALCSGLRLGEVGDGDTGKPDSIPNPNTEVSPIAALRAKRQVDV
jgi:hypothetical protein